MTEKAGRPSEDAAPKIVRRLVIEADSKLAYQIIKDTVEGEGSFARILADDLTNASLEASATPNDNMALAAKPLADRLDALWPRIKEGDVTVYSELGEIAKELRNFESKLSEQVRAELVEKVGKLSKHESSCCGGSYVSKEAILKILNGEKE